MADEHDGLDQLARIALPPGMLSTHGIIAEYFVYDRELSQDEAEELASRAKEMFGGNMVHEKFGDGHWYYTICESTP